VDVFQDTPFTASHSLLPEGHVAKCKDDAVMKVYRWTDKTLHWYPKGKITNYRFVWLTMAKGCGVIRLHRRRITIWRRFAQSYRVMLKIFKQMMVSSRFMSWMNMINSVGYPIQTLLICTISNGIRKPKYIHCHLYEYGEDANHENDISISEWWWCGIHS